MGDVLLSAFQVTLDFLKLPLQSTAVGSLTRPPFLALGRYDLLCRKRNDRSPLRLARDDNRNNHRAETEAGLRRIGPPT